MSTIHVNGRTRPIPDGGTCRDLVAELTGRDVGDNGRAMSGAALGVAVALGGDVIPRGQWAHTPLRAGDHVDVVTATQGG